MSTKMDGSRLKNHTDHGLIVLRGYYIMSNSMMFQINLSPLVAAFSTHYPYRSPITRSINTSRFFLVNASLLLYPIVYS